MPVGNQPRLDDEALFTGMYPDLRRFAAVVASGSQNADDVLHDALANVLRHGPIGELDAPAAYIRRAIVNVASNDRRRAARFLHALTRLGRPEGRNQDYPSDLSDLDSLEPTDRAILYLSEVDGLTLVEVAEAVGLSYTATRARSSRARRRLRLMINEEELR